MDPGVQANGAVWELSFDDLDSGWAKVGDAPDLQNLGGYTECSGHMMRIHDGTTETVYDADSRVWSSAAVIVRSGGGLEFLDPLN